MDVGGTTTKAEVVNRDGRVVAAASAPTPAGATARDALADLGQRLIGQATSDGHGPVTAAGVVVPGIVDRHRRVGVFSANIGWRDLAFGPTLEDAWGMPVRLDHDVTIAGWAEWQGGAGRGCDDVFFIALGTGVAATIVAGGHLVRGGLNQAGEFGHLVVRPGGPPCGCGARGCLEAVSSAAAIARAYNAVSGRQVTGADDVLAAMGEDPQAAGVWDEAVAALADGLLSVLNLLSPSLVVLGGGLAQAGDALTRPLREALRERATMTPVPDFALAHFGVRAGLAGAELLARRGGAED